MGRTIKSQIIFAITCNFDEGVKKREYKMENGEAMDHKIFGYAERNRLKDMAGTFGRFIKEKYPEVKKVNQITPRMVQSFLNKTKENVTQKSIMTYSQSLWKIEKVLAKTYRDFKQEWRTNVVVPSTEKLSSPNRGAKSVMSEADYKIIKEYCQSNKSQSAYAILLEGELGIRVNELAYLLKSNINFDKKTILITGKGGRDITRIISPSMESLLREILSLKNPKNLLLDIKTDSINKQLNRIQDKLGLEKHSVHDIRRLVAQKVFDSFRHEGLSTKEAMAKTSKWLSHGEKRDAMLIRSYIKPW